MAYGRITHEIGMIAPFKPETLVGHFIDDFEAYGFHLIQEAPSIIKLVCQRV